jgi:hypothetical protein
VVCCAQLRPVEASAVEPQSGRRLTIEPTYKVRGASRVWYRWQGAPAGFVVAAVQLRSAPKLAVLLHRCCRPRQFLSWRCPAAPS